MNHVLLGDASPFFATALACWYAMCAVAHSFILLLAQVFCDDFAGRFCATITEMVSEQGFAVETPWENRGTP